MLMIKEILLAGAGSFVGGALRYVVSQMIRTSTGGFPWGTFTVNILGSLFIGILWGITARNTSVPSWIPLFLMTGVCGGFTTFSTFSKESVIFLQSGNYLFFLIYTLGSLSLGILSVFLGYMITK